MIDWVTAIIPCHHRSEINGGIITSVTSEGELEWASKKAFSIEGSFSSSIQIKTHQTDGNLEYIWIHGNHIKFIQGHNIFGTDDLVGLMNEFLHKLIHQIPQLQPTQQDMANWEQGNFS